jgi:hypothetical protein
MIHTLTRAQRKNRTLQLDVVEARKRLVELDQRIKSGERSLELLRELEAAYDDYVKARIDDTPEEK